jgi:hypothetical protein
MYKLKLAPELLGRTQWVSGKSHKDMNALSYLHLQENGSVVAVFTDNSSMDVTELFPAAIIDSYRSHNILVQY